VKKIILMAAFVFLAGCTTNPITNDQAKEVSSERLLNKSLTVKNDGDGLVIIKRDAGARGSWCNVRVFTDGKALADLEPAEKVTVYMNAGNHVFSIQGAGACSGGLSSVAGNVEKDKTLTFRLGLGAVGGEYGIYPDAT
jgi:hypothetical protein